MRTPSLALTALCLLLAPIDSQAAIAWDAPFLMPPHGGSANGVYLVETAGGDLGAMATWRHPGAPHGLAWRLGVADRTDGRIGGFGGLQISGGLGHRVPELPLDIAWLAGAGAAIGDYLVVGVPVGVSVGRSFRSASALTLTPYLSPRLLLEGTFGRRTEAEGDPDRVALDLVMDLGLDLAFPAGWSLRFGATVGDRTGLALGVAF